MSKLSDSLLAWERLNKYSASILDNDLIEEAEREMLSQDLDTIYQHLKKQYIRMKNEAEGNGHLNREADRIEKFNAVTELRRQSNEGGK